MDVSVLEARALSIGYQRRRDNPHVLACDIDLTLQRGELVCVLGPNGAGKSTFLRTLTGLQVPVNGRVLLEGHDIHRLSPPERARAMSVVLTEWVTAGMFTAYDIVSLGRQPHTDWRGTLTPYDHAIVRRCLDAVHARDLAARIVAELSDGERQRVMVGRALAQEPRVMVLDEITAFLDLPRRVEIMRLLSQLAHDTGMAVLVSTHDLDLALRTADQLWLIAGGGAVQAGAPEDLLLDGSIERTFAAEGLAFDREDGAFRMRPATGETVAISGNGLAAHWTARAVERAGYHAVPVGTAADVSVSIEAGVDGATMWQLSTPSGAANLTSVQAVVSELRRLATHRATASTDAA
jgi:iron complex transport system ATP-binding protein